MTGALRTRMAWQFDGDLDDVTADAAAALARVAHALLRHGEEHDGRAATIRMARLGSSLHLWLTDPECSPACLCRSGHLPGTADHEDAPPGDVRLVMDPHRDGGLRLHWVLVLAEEPPPPPRPGDETPNEPGDEQRAAPTRHRGGRSQR